MFDNIGGKIKGFAKVMCILGMVLSGLSGVVSLITMLANSRYMNFGAIIGGILGILLGTGLGILLSWIGSFFTYGFGELIENTQSLAQQTRRTNTLMESMIRSNGGEVPSERPSFFSKPSAVATTTYATPWTCKTCGSANASGTPFCKDCGAYK